MADFQDTCGKKVDDVIDDVTTALLPVVRGEVFLGDWEGSFGISFNRYGYGIVSWPTSAWSDVALSLLLFSEETAAKLLFDEI